jgi:hypothetical protein
MIALAHPFPVQRGGDLEAKALLLHSWRRSNKLRRRRRRPGGPAACRRCMRHQRLMRFGHQLYPRRTMASAELPCKYPRLQPWSNATTRALAFIWQRAALRPYGLVQRFRVSPLSHDPMCLAYQYHHSGRQSEQSSGHARTRSGWSDH